MYTDNQSLAKSQAARTYANKQAFHETLVQTPAENSGLLFAICKVIPNLV